MQSRQAGKCSRNVCRRHRCSLSICVGIIARFMLSCVGKRVHTKVSACVYIATRRRNVDAFAKVRIRSTLTGGIGCTNRNHIVAIGRRILANIAVGIACSNGNNTAIGNCCINRLLKCFTASGLSRKRQVDYLSWIWVVFNTLDASTRRPNN